MGRFRQHAPLVARAVPVSSRVARSGDQGEAEGDRAGRAGMIWPAWVQRCGIGSSCECPPRDQLAGVQRDLQRATAGGGAALPVGTRAAMEDAFAADFSAVRVHTGPASDRVASGLGARALTAGRDIMFGPGGFRPHTPGGDRLLAHELAHVVQQAGGLPRAAIDGGAADPLEKAAETAADQAVTSGRVAGLGPAAPARERGWRAADRGQALPARVDAPRRHGGPAGSDLSPGSPGRGESLAYELSHVVQRSSRASAIQRVPENDDDHLSEWAAGAAADNVVRAVQTARARAEGSTGHGDGAEGSARTPRDDPQRRPGEGVHRRATAAPVLTRRAGPAIQRQVARASSQPTPPHPRRLELEVVGSDESVDKSLAVMAGRWAHGHGGRVLRVSSLEDMISQIEGLLGAATCLGQLVIWYHGSPEIQLIVGEYPLPPKNLRLPASGFSREWLQLERNRAALTRFRHFFCCDALMHWMGCGTVIVRAGGGLRTPAELEREPAEFQEFPDVYQSAGEARRHGAKLAGASFGMVNAQAWANAACVTVRGATDFVTVDHKSRTPITIDNHGRWIDVRPQSECPCDPSTGRIAGEAPSRAEMVEGWQKETSALVGRENVLWHELLLALRTGVPHETEVVGAGGQGERTFQARTGTLPAALLWEMQHRVGDKRGPLEKYYAVRVMRPLLQIAGAGVTPPAPLPNLPIPDDLTVQIAVGGTWAAVTQRQLAVVHRNDFWHWMVFSDRAIGETPEFTRTVIQHELQHAADYETDLRAFEATHPRPASTPPIEFGFPADEGPVRAFGGEWGKYINDFIAFQESRTRPERHLEIILGQRHEVAPAGGPSWDRWSAAERAYWFQLVFNNLPPDVIGGSPLPGEDEVLAVFRNGGPALKLAAVARAYEAIDAALCPKKEGKPGEPKKEVEPGEIAKRRANARTLVQHFDPIIEQVLRERMQETPRATVLDLLRRPPEHPRGMECQP
jgi:hypothetical protein